MYNIIYLVSTIPNTNLIEKLINCYISTSDEFLQKLISKCFTLFIDDRILEHVYKMCGIKSLLYMLLTPTLDINTRDIILHYVRQLKEVKEKSFMSRATSILGNDKIINLIMYKPLTYFLYDNYSLSLVTSEYFSLLPEFDGEKCHFSIKPKLPNGITLNERSGELSGSSKNLMDNVRFTVTCTQFDKSLSFDLFITVLEFRFMKSRLSQKLTLSDSGKRITSSDSGYQRSYINVKLESGIYHVIFKSYPYHQNCTVFFGVAAPNNGSQSPCYDDSTYLMRIDKNGTKLYGDSQVETPNFCNHHDDVYEFIYDMNNCMIKVKQNYSRFYTIYSRITAPLYPYVGLDQPLDSIVLLSVTKE